MRNLILFSLLLTSACAKTKTEEIRLIWVNDQATAVSIPTEFIHGIFDSLDRRLAVRLASQEDPTNIFGNFKIVRDDVIFEPLVPFTRGLRYEILGDNRMLGEVTIPLVDPTMAPRLLAIYPTTDTVPENLLKIYLRFSKPMQEGQSLRFITLLKKNRDTVAGAFLDLQPELWNADRTMLTVWIDPGRIKRDLQPNRLYGAPLLKGESYTLVVSDVWRDIQGNSLATSSYKNFVAALRDSLTPDPKMWTIHEPKIGTAGAMVIDLKSPLDYSLLNATLHLVDGMGRLLPGQWQVSNEERNASFIPEQKWVAGDYKLQIETRLEDLAGNNLNRAFEVNVRTNTSPASSSKMISIQFSCTN